MAWALPKHHAKQITRLLSTKKPLLTTHPTKVNRSNQCLDLSKFREEAFIPKKPFQFKTYSKSLVPELPAQTQWFKSRSNGTSAAEQSSTYTPYLRSFRQLLVPFEIVIPDDSSLSFFHDFQKSLENSKDVADQELDRAMAKLLHRARDESEPQTFFQCVCPLDLLFKALKFNERAASQGGSPLRLYIAQCSISDLPSELQEDVPIPQLVQQAGKGDVYASSIWLGTEPTYTPLHRDPNPNLFSQLCRRKHVRLLPPPVGEDLFHEVQLRLGQHGNSRIRDASMMQNEEKDLFHELVWRSEKYLDYMQHADVGPGDCLFIPKGWWHSLQSQGCEGLLNGSVNWWFR